MQATNQMILWTKRRIKESREQAIFAGTLESEIAQQFDLSFPANIKACQNMVERGVIRATKTPTFFLLP